MIRLLHAAALPEPHRARLRAGLPDPDYREELGQAAMDGAEITIRVEMNLGQHAARIWTSANRCLTGR